VSQELAHGLRIFIAIFIEIIDFWLSIAVGENRKLQRFPQMLPVSMERLKEVVKTALERNSKSVKRGAIYE
jgi:hypothetical protein